MPFGFGLPALTPLRRAVVPLCFLGSLLIEVLQWAFGTGVSQVEDILLNTLGAALGYALFHAVHPATRSPAADESHAESAEGAESESHAENAESAESESHAENAESAESESHAESAESTML